MKRKWFSVGQIVAILKQAEMGMTMAELIRRLRMREQTFYLWNKQFTGFRDRPSSSAQADPRRTRPAEEVDGRTDFGPGDVAERSAKKLVTPSRRPGSGTYLCGAYRVSERRACKVVLLPRRRSHLGKSDRGS